MIETSLRLLWCFLLRFLRLSRNVGKCSLHIISKQKHFPWQPTAMMHFYLFCEILHAQIKLHSLLEFHNFLLRFAIVLWIIIAVSRCMQMMVSAEHKKKQAANIFLRESFLLQELASARLFEHSPHLNWIISRKFRNKPKKKIRKLLFIFAEKGREVGEAAAEDIHA